VKIDGNSFVSSVTAAGTYYGIVAEGSSLDHITIRNNSYQATNSATPTHVPILVRVSNTSNVMSDVRVDSNDIALNTGSSNGAISFDASASLSRGIVVNHNSVRAAGTTAVGIKFLGNFEAHVGGNAISGPGTSISANSRGSGACSLTISGNSSSVGKLSLLNACRTGSVVTGNRDQRAVDASSIGGMGKPAVLVRGYRNGSVDFTAGTPVVVPFNRFDVDNGGNYDVRVDGFVTPNPGVYRVRACVRFDGANFAEGESADVELAGTGISYAFNRVVAGGSDFHSCVDDLLSLSASAIVQVKVSASGTNGRRTILGLGRYSSFFSVERVSDLP